MSNTAIIEQVLQSSVERHLPFRAAFDKNVSVNETDDLLQTVPLHIPYDVQIYLTWLHPLEEDNIPPELSSGWIFHGGHLLSHRQILESYQQDVQLYKDLSIYKSGPFTAQDPYLIIDFFNVEKINWLSLFGTGASAEFRVICSEKEQWTTAPIYYHAYDGGLTYLAFDSLTSLLLTTVAAYESGAYWIQQGNYYVREDRAKLAPIINHYNPRRRAYFFHFAQAHTIAEVVQQLDQTDGEVRHHAIRALQHLYEPEIVPLLIERLRHPMAEQRQLAVELLGELEDKAAVEPLIPLLQDAVPAVQLAVVNALSEFRDSQTIEPFMGLLNSQDDKIRERIIYGLGELRAQAAVPALIAIAAKSALSLRQEAISALGKIADPAAVPVLITALRDESALVRARAIKALEWIGDTRALEPLAVCATLTSSPPHDYLPQLAREAIAAIEARHQ